jgi:hypothetical protein
VNLCEGWELPPPSAKAIEAAEHLGVDPKTYWRGLMHLCQNPKADRRAVLLEILKSCRESTPA